MTEQANLYLGIDQGTSSTKAALISTNGEVQAQFSAEVLARTEKDDHVEQDPENLLNSIEDILLQVLPDYSAKIKGIGFAFQRSGVTAFQSKDGKSLHPLITWADTRTSGMIERLGTRVNQVSDKTGLPVIPNFSAGKIALLQAKFQDPSVFVGTLDSFVLHRLLGSKVFVTDDSMAARTMLYSLRSSKWDSELSNLFNVNASRLPLVNPSIHHHGNIKHIPVLASLGDQQAAFLGRLSTNKYPLLNLGTIAALLVDTEDKLLLKPGLMSSVFYTTSFLPHRPGFDREFRYLTEMTSPITGSLLQESTEKKKYASSLSELDKLCSDFRATNPGGALIYSAYGSKRLPAWVNGVPDVIIEGETPSQQALACAWVENVGNHIIRLIEEMEAHGAIFNGSDRSIMISGGGSESEYLVQYIADVTGIRLHKISDLEATARGAAIAALMANVPRVSPATLNSNAANQFISVKDSTRRKRYMQWLKLEREVLAGKIPEKAKVENRS